MGIIFLIIGGIIGYNVGDRVTASNWVAKIFYSLLPLIACLLIVILVAASATDGWAAYNAGSTMAPFVFASIVYGIFMLVKVKIEKNADEVKEDKVSSPYTKVYLRKSNGSKVRQCGVVDGAKQYEDVERNLPVGVIDDEDLMEFTEHVDTSKEEEKKHSNDWIFWVIALLLIAGGLKLYNNYQEKKAEEALREIMSNPRYYY